MCNSPCWKTQAEECGVQCCKGEMDQCVSIPHVPLHLLGHISDDGFGTSLKDQLPLDEGRHIVRLGGGVCLVCFHGYLCGIATVIAVLSEDSKLFLQLDLLAVQNVMSYNQHWHPLVEGGRRAGKTRHWGNMSENCS